LLIAWIIGVNFTAYQEFKRLAKEYQPQYAATELPSWQARRRMRGSRATYVLMVSIGAFENGPMAPEMRPRTIVCHEGNSVAAYCILLLAETMPLYSRIQKASKEPGETALSRFTKVTVSMFKEEGPAAFYKSSIVLTRS
jgi:solute carrier family 25 citrate transporter 1